MKPRLESENIWKIAALGIALFAILTRLWVWHGSGYAGEDAYITMRYAENIAAGRGFVFNAGERVLGTTTPLGTLLVALGVKLGFDAIAFSRCLGILADGATTYLMARFLARPALSAPWAGLWAALFFALDSTAQTIAVSGMETPLVTLAGMVGISAVASRRPTLLAICAAALLLLRIDTLILVVVLGFLGWRSGLRFKVRDALFFLLPLLGWAIFATLYFGSPLPNSLRAKMWAYPPHENIGAFIVQFWGPIGKIPTLLALAGGLLVVSETLRLTKSKANVEDNAPLVLAAAFGWMLLYFGALCAGRRPIFYWYFGPPLPIYWMLAVWSVVALARRRNLAFSLLDKPKTMLAAGTLGATLLLFGGWQTARTTRSLRQQQAFDNAVIPPLTQYLRENVREGEQVLLEPIGYIGYFSMCRVLDMIGLVSPEVAVSYRTRTPLADMTRRFKPQWLCLRPAEVARLERQDGSVLKHDYIAKRAFTFGKTRRVAYQVFERL